MIVSARTDVGLVRSNNEDSYLLLAPHVFAVADGMGGHAAGETASEMTVAKIRQSAGAGDLQEAIDLAAAIEAANLAIYRRAQSESALQGMGTTATAILLEGLKVHWAHVGDSRLYHFFAGGFRQVTSDHTLVGEMARSGSLTPQEAKTHPRRNLLTRAVGTGESLLVEQGSFELNQGDYLLLCTDGLTGVVSEEEFRDVLQDAASDLEGKADKLLDLAKAGGAPDNVTFILILSESADDEN